MVVNHLLETEQTNTFGPLVVKLASYKRGGSLFVRDLDIFNAYDAWKKACKFGSPMLGMTQARSSAWGWINKEVHHSLRQRLASPGATLK